MHPETQAESSRFFRFSCTMCGDCCSGNISIPLNLHDLYMISSFRDYTNSAELFSRGLARLVRGEHNVLMPVMRFKGKRIKFCPFLLNTMGRNGEWQGVCSLHPHFKPLVCHLAPAGRVVDLETGINRFLFVPPTGACPGMRSGEMHLYEDLQRTFRRELDYEERYYRLLESVKHRNYDEQKMLRDFYSFSMAQDFDAVIGHLEQVI